MALLTRLTTYDSWVEMESAALHRYFDGLSLATSDSDRRTGALYVLGYTAEILVKTAYYRIRGAGPADDVAAELRNMPARARSLGLDWQGNRHNLESLAELLVNERAFVGFAMDAMLAAEFQAHVSNIGAHWSEVLRYKGTIAFESELVAVFESVEWLVANHAQLWS